MSLILAAKFLSSPLLPALKAFFKSYLWNSGHEPELCIHMYLFFLHPWFLRGWTFQEAVLPRKSRILTYGYEVCTTLLQQTCFVLSIGDTKSQAPYQFAATSEGLRRYWKMYDRVWSTDLLSVLDAIAPKSNLGLTQDYVYGLIGIMNCRFIDLEYGTQWYEVFTKAAARIIELGSTLCLLGYIHRSEDLRTSASSSRDQPSWVPNWTGSKLENKWQDVRLWTDDHTRFTVCKSRGHQWSPLPDLSCLSTQGGKLGQIEYVLNGQTKKRSRVAALRHLLNLANKHVTKSEAARIPPSSLPVSGAKYSSETSTLSWLASSFTFLYHSIGRRDAPISAATRHVDRLFLRLVTFKERSPRGEYLIPGPQYVMDPHKVDLWSSLCYLDFSNSEPERAKSDYNEDLANVLESKAKLIIAGETMFVLDSGILGHSMSLVSIECGDIVCILHGLPVPAILTSRPRLDSSGRPIPMDGKRRFLGLCYVKGCANGSLVTWEED